MSSARPDGAALDGLITGLLRDVPDFPKPGILFKDITPLLADGPAFGAVVAGLAGIAALAGDTGRDRSGTAVELVAGVEARGFLMAGALADRLGCGTVPVRKAGKLPPPTLGRRYELEYGSAEIEIPAGAVEGRRVLLLDDVLATGGTLRAAAELLAEAGADVVGLAVVVELTALGGREALAGLAPLSALARV